MLSSWIPQCWLSSPPRPCLCAELPALLTHPLPLHRAGQRVTRALTAPPSPLGMANAQEEPGCRYTQVGQVSSCYFIKLQQGTETGCGLNPGLCHGCPGWVQLRHHPAMPAPPCLARAETAQTQKMGCVGCQLCAHSEPGACRHRSAAQTRTRALGAALATPLPPFPSGKPPASQPRICLPSAQLRPAAQRHWEPAQAESPQPPWPPTAPGGDKLCRGGADIGPQGCQPSCRCQPALFSWRLAAEHD